MVGKDVENVRNSYGENATDFIIEIKHNLVKYVIVVGYNLVVLFGYSEVRFHGSVGRAAHS